ncbi:hypothetical protein [Thioalbus denitrificans]|uniref:hypothetical protein n=1 Tax=Thioalbus denitrificans TaxID=547122 RepID=UPI000DF23FA6|nr:hypothetical protein [Thioalbus denitrificans]
MRLLRYYGYSVRQVSQHLGSDPTIAYKALDRERCHRMLHGNLLKIRRVVEGMLASRGWRGKPAELWTEYDDSTRKAA